MPTHTAQDSTVEVFTFRDGLLSAVAHDLLLSAASFRITVDPAAPSVELEVDARSLRVVTALRDGKRLPDALRAADRQEIERATARDVLRAAQAPAIRFVSTAVLPAAEGYRVMGRLSLAGVERELALVARRSAGRLVADVKLHQPDFGIRPYRAMMGTLKVRPTVLVRVSVPEPA